MINAAAILRIVMFTMIAFALTACGSRPAPNALPAAQVPEFSIPTYELNLTNYHLGAKDKLRIETFREPDLSIDEIVVESGGNISFPLIGRLNVMGLTVGELSKEIETRLSERFLRNPNVTVYLVEAAADTVVVEGAVNFSGAFPIEGNMTLLKAIALARGTSDIASRDDIVIFRTMGERRLAALFDLNAIESGNMQDPLLMKDDIVVVSVSNGRRVYEDLLQATPLFAAVFRVIL